MDLPDPFPVKPFKKPVSGSVTLPGSKSLNNRALVIGALAEGETSLQNALFSRDSRILLTALKELGFSLTTHEKTPSITICGEGGRFPVNEARLHVGNAGTAARFLTALLSLHPSGKFHLDGDEAMRRRPMQGLLDALRQQGTRFHFDREKGHFPFTMETSGWHGGNVKVDARASSQILSALMMAAPFARKPVTITLQGETVSRPFVDMTAGLMRLCGQESLRWDPATGTVSGLQPRPYRFPANPFPIEPDATAASYFLALPLVTRGEITIRHFPARGLQGDRLFTRIVEQAGASCSALPNGLHVAFHDDRCPVSADFNAISDTFLTIAAISPLFPGRTLISGIAHTRKQETDRVAHVAVELRKLGQSVIETEDSLTIEASPENLRSLALMERFQQQRISIATYEDHRFAMSFALLGSYDLLSDGQPWLEIVDPACCGKTFPGFFQTLDALHPSSAES